MSKYPLCLISRIVRAVLLTSIVIAQTDLETIKVKSPVEHETEHEKNIYEGLKLYKHFCQSTYKSSRTDFIIPFLLTGHIADETDRNAKCFFLCMIQMTGAADSRNGPYDPKQASLLFAPPKNIALKGIEHISVECTKKQVKEDLCDEAYHFTQCVVKEMLHKYGTPEFNETTTSTTTELSFINYNQD